MSMNKFKDILAIVILVSFVIGILYVTWPYISSLLPIIIGYLLIVFPVLWAVGRVMYWPRRK